MTGGNMKTLIFEENVVQRGDSKKVNVVYHAVENRGCKVCY
ncbi:hypothetical protein bthur0014_45040 [Bacillus thuringiensis IBL 4222]|nr:hypothetical protein bthur0014_45040 [Bacillus thuringiensis IBL 4222]